VDRLSVAFDRPNREMNVSDFDESALAVLEQGVFPGFGD